MKYFPLRNTLQALSYLFSDMVNNSEESSGEQSLEDKASHEHSKERYFFVGHLLSCLSFPFCSSHLFQSVSLTGSRVLQQSGIDNKKVISLTNICLYMKITIPLSINKLPKMEEFL